MDPSESLRRHLYRQCASILIFEVGDICCRRGTLRRKFDGSHGQNLKAERGIEVRQQNRVKTQ